MVTGGAGFIGSHLVEKLLGTEEVVCVDDFNDFYDPTIKRRNLELAIESRNFHLRQGDIRDLSFLDGVFREFPLTEVIHLAARAGVRPSLKDPLLYEDVNGRGTLNILDLCRKYEVKTFIFGGSSSVYGINNKIPFSEDDEISRPVSPYAATKRANELICYTYHHLYGIHVTVLRFFNEVANLCEKVGADVHHVARAMGLDGRIGPKFLHPGPGYGGSCFPKDTLALAHL